MNKKKFFYILSGLVIIALFIFLANRLNWLTRKSPTLAPGTANKLLVTTSFYPLYFFAAQIGGAKAEVINITPTGLEPHDYEPTARDLVLIENSRLLILNGQGLEAWGNNLEQNLDSRRTTVVKVGEGLSDRELTSSGKNQLDPHVWLSPPKAEKLVTKILQGFSQVDPTNTNYYETNAAELQSKLRKLDQDYQQGLSQCANKNIITSHAAFAYLAAAYGLNQVSIAGLSPEAEPSPRQLADLAALAKNQKIKYIFFESLASPKLAETLANEVGAQTLVLNPLEGLNNEDLQNGQNYFTIMQTNLTNLKIALQCP